MEGGEEATRRVRVYPALGPAAVADKLGTDHHRQHLYSPEAEGELEAEMCPMSRIGIGKKSKTNCVIHDS